MGGAQDAQEAVLGRFIAKPDYGYGVAKQLEGSWSRATVYEEIERLRDLGLIEHARVEGRRKYFRATPEGLRFHAARVAGMLLEAAGIADRLLSVPVEEIPAVIDEFHTQVLANAAESPKPGGGFAAELAIEHRKNINEASLKTISWARKNAPEA